MKTGEQTNMTPKISAISPTSIKQTDMTSLAINYDKNIRPLLDAVDRLRNLKVTQEGITLPSIVVVGDQSSGKSSVLESLATISLPRGQGVATRVPVVLRLQSCNLDQSSITILYKDQKKIIKEAEIEDAVNQAQNVLAGAGKGITDDPISLHINKPGAPDLTMIDLPGITRVPVHGQPRNIYDQIAAMIRHYIKPKETVILNVLSAAVDFSTCESILMSQQEDKKGERTLAVVTKVDRAPDGLFEKVSSDDINIGLGYICVRNRTDSDRSHEEAREQEKALFDFHPSLSKLDKGMVGIPALAERLTRIQADIIRKNLPAIQEEIRKALMERRKELDLLTRGASGGEDVAVTFLKIIDENKRVMENIMIYGIYEELPDIPDLHYPARLHEMFQILSGKLHQNLKEICSANRTEEIITEMVELRGVSLPNFLPPMLMKSLVCQEIDKVDQTCHDLVPQTHEFARKFVFTIVDMSTNAYPVLRSFYKKKVEEALNDSQTTCSQYVKKMLMKERNSVYTTNDYYLANVTKMKEKLKELKEKIKSDGSFTNKMSKGHGKTVCSEESETSIDVQEALEETHVNDSDYQSAFQMKISLAAYWKVVHKRMADELALEIRLSLQNAILATSRTAILKNMMGKDISALMKEDPAISVKRQKLMKRLKTLIECKDVLQPLVDQVI